MQPLIRPKKIVLPPETLQGSAPDHKLQFRPLRNSFFAYETQSYFTKRKLVKLLLNIAKLFNDHILFQEYAPFKFSEAVVQSYSVKKVFLEIS